jgi:hypothetical protein
LAGRPVPSVVVALFRRSKDPVAGTDTGADTGTDTDPAVESAPRGQVPKGRPTPKRRQTSPARGPATPAPQTRKEAVRYQRTKLKAERSSAGPTRRRTAADPNALPRRDQGPLKALARDWVDTHRMLSNFLMAALPVLLLSFLVPILGVFVYALLLAVLIEWFLTGRRIRNLAIARNIEVSQSAMGIGYYAGTRAYTPRRWRMPKPKHQLGDAI